MLELITYAGGFLVTAETFNLHRDRHMLSMNMLASWRAVSYEVIKRWKLGMLASGIGMGMMPSKHEPDGGALYNTSIC